MAIIASIGLLSSATAQVTDTGNEVGIGVGSPAHKLDVDGDINMSSGSALRVDGSKVLDVPGTSNVHLGVNAGSVSAGSFNVFLGDDAGETNSSGSYNMFLGYRSGRFNTTGSRNLKIGYGAGLSGTSGNDNTFLGQFAGALSTVANDNVFIGSRAGYSNTTGIRNTAIGKDAGRNLTTSNYNAFIGYRAGYNNTTGGNNSLIGYAAGFNNTTASYNTFIGMNAGLNTVGGGSNTFVGYRAGLTNTSGTNNTYIGNNARGSAGIDNATAIGTNAFVGADSSLVLGDNAKVGIGTSAPGYDLDVAGDINFTGILYENGVPFTGGAGATGPTGPDGATGPAGADGADGADGATGPAGADGANGSNGLDGADGATGATGPAGADGADGAAGADGATGPAGADGATGPAGADGATGPTGPLVSGSSGQTLRHNGSSWVASSLLDNDGSTIRIGNSGAPAAPGNTIMSVQGDISGTGFNYLTRITSTSTQSTGSGINILNSLTGNQAGATHTGLYNQVNGTSGTHKGVYHFINGTTSSSQYGVHANLSNGSGNSYGVYSDAGSTGSNYAAYLTATGGSSNYAVYAAAGESYFADDVGVGTDSPEAEFNVQNGKILVGTANGVLADLTVNTDGTQEIFRGRVNNTTNFIIDENGNVGMGNQNPTERLVVDGNASFQDSVYVDKLLGVGTTSPTYSVDIDSDLSRAMDINNTYTGTTTKYGIRNDVDAGGTGTRYGLYNNVTANSADNSSTYGVRSIATGNGNAGSVYGVYSSVSTSGTGNRYAIYGSATTTDPNPGVTRSWAGYFSGNTYFSGDVRMGVLDDVAGYKLAVDGDVICEELKVQDSGSWPDYVFASDYDLRSLEDVEAHIQAKSHLPGVPNAATVEEEGIKIGQMQKLLMEKVEELTLYMIDADKRIKALEAENAQLKENK